MNAASTTPAVWTERYEALRQCAQEGCPILASRPLGWTLLAGQGMVGWMRRWTEAPPYPPAPSAARGPQLPLPLPGWQTPLTLLLAQMTAAHLSTSSRP